MRSLLLAALLAAGPAMADELEFRNGKTFIRLQDKACESQRVLSILRSDVHDRFRSGYMQHEGRLIQLCWTLEGNDVIVVDEDGDGGAVPAIAFSLAKGT